MSGVSNVIARSSDGTGVHPSTMWQIEFLHKLTLASKLQYDVQASLCDEAPTAALLTNSALCCDMQSLLSFSKCLEAWHRSN